MMTIDLINVMIIRATITATAIITYAAFVYLLERIDKILTKRKRQNEHE